MSDVHFTNTAWPYEKELHERIKTLDLELTKSNDEIRRLRTELEFYARHHHMLPTTAPNFARIALDRKVSE